MILRLCTSVCASILIISGLFAQVEDQPRSTTPPQRPNPGLQLPRIEQPKDPARNVPPADRPRPG
jgi:hypothetical protein